MIHSICGLQNDGKTLALTRFAELDFLDGRTIFSNYWLSFKHYLINKDFIIWLGKTQPNLVNTSVFLDEAWLWLDCRSLFLGKGIENTISTYFFLQSSKNNTSIYMTAQHLSTMEIRVQNNLNLYTECKRYILLDNKLQRIISPKRDLGKEWNDKVYIEVKTHTRNLNIRENNFKLSSTEYIKAQRYFALYNTYEKKVIV